MREAQNDGNGSTKPRSKCEVVWRKALQSANQCQCTKKMSHPSSGRSIYIAKHTRRVDVQAVLLHCHKADIRLDVCRSHSPKDRQTELANLHEVRICITKGMVFHDLIRIQDILNDFLIDYSSRQGDRRSRTSWRDLTERRCGLRHQTKGIFCLHSM
jgi:hypothetical protein